MRVNAVPASKPPICPRCLYDQSGETVRWLTECPLSSTCPECGLRFEWGDVLGNVRPPRWWIENVNVGATRGVPATLARTLRPYKLWRAIRMEYAGHLARAVTLLAVVIAAVIVAEMAFLLAILFQIYQGLKWDPQSRMRWEELLWPHHLWEQTGPLYILLFAFLLAFSMAVLPETRRRAHVARRHIVRVALYAACAGFLIDLFGLLIAIGIMGIGEYQRTPGPFSTNDLSRMAANARNLGVLASYAFISLSWIAACRHYLRLDRPTWVAASLIALAAIATFTIVVCIAVIKFYGWRHAIFG